MAEDWLTAAVDAELQGSRPSVRAAAIGQRDVSLAPDQAAQVWKQGEQQGRPPALALRNPDAVREEADLARLDTLSPTLSDWIAAKPERLAIARDDLDGLSLFDRTLTNLLPLSDGGRRAYRDRVRPALDRLGERFQIGSVLPVSGAQQAIGESIDAPVRSIGNIFGTLYDKAAEQADADGKSDAAEAARRAAEAWRSDLLGAREVAQQGAAVTAEAQQDRQAVAAQAERPSSVGDLFDRPGNALEYYGGIVADSTPSTLLAIATRSPRAAAATIGGTTGAQTYGSSRAEGRTPAQAAQEAVTQGGIESAFALSPFEIALQGRGPLRVPAAIGSEAASEGATELAQTNAQDALRGTETPVREQLLQALDATVAGGGTGLVQAITGAHPQRVQEVEQRLDASAQDAERIAELHQVAAQLKTLDRTPGEVETLVRSIVDRTPDMPTHVYLDAGALRTYFQSANLDPQAEIEQLTGDPDALAVADAGGGDVKIPIERYVARAVKSPHAEAYQNLARLAPDRASNAELQNLDVDALLGDLAPPAASAEGTAAPDAAGEIAGEVQAQLEAAGVERSAAQAQAQLIAQRYVTRAERRGLGESALDLYRNGGLTIRGAGDADTAGPGALSQAPIDAGAQGYASFRRVLESGGRADARNPNSSATGADQFTEGTWRNVVAQASPAWAEGLSDAELLAARTDPERSAEMAEFLDRQNADALTAAGQPVNRHTLYAAHHFGQAGGVAFARADGDTPMAEILTPEQIAANPYLRDLTKAEAIANWDERARAAGVVLGDADRAFSQGPVYGDDPVLAGLSMLAQDEEAFQLPRSNAMTLEAIARDQEGDRGVTVTREDDLAMFAEDEGAEQAYRVTMPDGSKGVVYESPDAVWIDVSDLKQGGDGKRVYNMVANYAYNTGKTFIGDPAGLSDVAQARRLENMISSALKFGTTRHLWPHDRQRSTNPDSQVPGIDWRDGDDVHNLREMVSASLASAEAQFPEIVNLRYDPAHDQIIDTRTGEPHSRDSLAALAGSRRADIAATQGRRAGKTAATGGSTSIERAVLVGSLLRGTREEQSAILARLGLQRSQRLKGVFYQDEQTPPEGGVSASGDRGRILFGRDGARVIELLAGADLSTFHHESGHLFLDELVEDAFAEGTPDALREDLDRLLSWWGVDARTKDGKAAVEQAIGTEQHERFARGYEAYLFEGKAPSPALADLFARFRSWMIAVYRSLRRLDVTLTDEVRSVYDRLLAADDEIAAATTRQGYEPLALPEDVRSVLSPSQWRSYQASVEDAVTEARQDVEQRLLAAQQREAKAWWRERKAEVEEQVTGEAHARPDFQALSLLSRGRMPDGSEAPAGLDGLSLDRAALVEQYGERFVIDRLGPKKVYRKAGGLTPDAAAAVLGYRNGGALVDALVNAPRMREWIDTETTRRMRDQYPDPLLDGSLPEQAMAAVHNDKRLQAMEAELQMLGEVAEQPVPPSRILGAAARMRIAGMKRRDIRPNDYLVAERRAARQATQAAAAGRYAEALQFKRQQTLSAHLYRAARDATEEFDKARDYLQRFTRKDKRADLGKAGGSYLEQVDQLLELVELRPASLREVGRRQSLLEWVERPAAEGEGIDVPDSVLDLARLTNLRDMPMEQIRGLVDTIKQIDHLARLKTKLMLGAQERDRAEVDAELAASVRAARESVPDRTGDRTRADNIRKAVNQGLGAYLRPSTLARDLDGFEDGGAVWRNTVGEVQDAVNNRLNPALREADEKLAEIWRKHYSLPELRRMNDAVYREEVGDTWSKGRILSLALNWGNAGNREALLSSARGRLSEQDVAALLQTLDARDAAFLNDVWAFIDSYWPQISATQRRRTGLVPEKIEADPFVVRNRNGEELSLTGGYYPLKYEPDSSAKADQDEQTEFWDAIRTGRFAKAQTRNGHTKERVGSGGRTVRLDMGVLSSHVRDVLRDIHLGDAVNNVHRVLRGEEFRGALADVGKLEYGRALELWLRDVATGEMAPRTTFERVARKIRTNMSASLLGFNVSSALVQPTGFLQTGAALGWSTLRTGLKRLLSEPWTGPNSVWKEIDAASPMMAQRNKQSVEAVQQVGTALAGKRGNPLAPYAWAMMARTQRIVDAVTWLGAEARGLDEFDGDVAKARQFADDAVQRAQASGEFIDKSALERGTLGENVRQAEIVRAFTALMSYMIAKGNVAYERTGQTSFRDPKQVAKWTADMVSLFVIEQMLIDTLRGGLPDDDDDDGRLDDWVAYLGKTATQNTLGTIPGIGQLVSELRGYNAQSPVQRFYSLIGDASTQAEQGDVDEAAIKSAVNIAGAATGLPSAQTNRTLDAIWAARDGEEVSPLEYLTGRRKDD